MKLRIRQLNCFKNKGMICHVDRWYLIYIFFYRQLIHSLIEYLFIQHVLHNKMVLIEKNPHPIWKLCPGMAVAASTVWSRLLTLSWMFIFVMHKQRHDFKSLLLIFSIKPLHQNNLIYFSSKQVTCDILFSQKRRSIKVGVASPTLPYSLIAMDAVR